ncbi:MAG: hypothetical protein MHM6MM_002503 [Cercozoa sp. M6MM]
MSDSSGADYDEVGRCNLNGGELVRDRDDKRCYRVLRRAGVGTFGTVYSVLNERTGHRTAIKIVRSVPRYLDAAEIEVEILEKMKRRAEAQGIDLRERSIVPVIDHFWTKQNENKHLVIEFESLGPSLYDEIKANRHRGFRFSRVRNFAKQMCRALDFMHTTCDLTHTDIKPENVLLVDAHRDEIRVIDFGGATFSEQHHSKMVNTRQYRAPEVILGLPWSHSSDMWSLGCMLVELVTGALLFQTHEDHEHLALMERILDKDLPQSMLQSAAVNYRRRARRHDRRKDKRDRSPSVVPLENVFEFDRSSDKFLLSRLSQDNDEEASASPDKVRMIWPPRVPHPRREKDTVEFVRHAPRIADSVRRALRRQSDPDRNDSKMQRDFADLVHRMLDFSPSRRISAADALRHSFFQ